MTRDLKAATYACLLVLLLIGKESVRKVSKHVRKVNKHLIIYANVSNMIEWALLEQMVFAPSNIVASLSTRFLSSWGL